MTALSQIIVVQPDKYGEALTRAQGRKALTRLMGRANHHAHVFFAATYAQYIAFHPFLGRPDMQLALSNLTREMECPPRTPENSLLRVCIKWEERWQNIEDEAERNAARTQALKSMSHQRKAMDFCLSQEYSPHTVFNLLTKRRASIAGWASEEAQIQPAMSPDEENYTSDLERGVTVSRPRKPRTAPDHQREPSEPEAQVPAKKIDRRLTRRRFPEDGRITGGEAFLTVAVYDEDKLLKRSYRIARFTPDSPSRMIKRLKEKIKYS
jgi:hypothetical protein